MALTSARRARKSRRNIAGAVKSAAVQRGSTAKFQAPKEAWREMADKVLGPRGDATPPLAPGGHRIPADPSSPFGGRGDDEVTKLPSKGTGLGPARRKSANGPWVDLSKGYSDDPALLKQLGGPDQPDANSNYHEFVQSHGGRSTARLGGLFSQNTGRKLTPKMRAAVMRGALARRT